MKSTILSLLFLTQKSWSSGWNYEHMDKWSTDHSMCDNDDQSPIDIKSSDAVYDKEVCLPYLDWDIAYEYTDFKVTNNGHAIVLQPLAKETIDPDGDLASTFFDRDGSEWHTRSLAENTIAKFENHFTPPKSPHEEFCLHSFHFHWGRTDETGSEHFVDGHQYALEVHFVHYSCAHASLGTTLDQFATEADVSAMEAKGEDSHQLGVIGIFFDVIEDEEYHNAAFDALLNNATLASVKLPGHNTTMVHGLNLKDLIPEDIDTDGYFAYEGSLTTPPCTDIVRWHVMNARGKIGKSQMERFRQLSVTHEDDKGVKHEAQIAPNYREIQDKYHTVYGCMDAPDFSAELEAEKTARTIVWIVAVLAIMAPIVMGIVCCRRAKKEMQNMGENKSGTTKH